MVLAMTSLVGNTQTASGLGVLGAVSCAVRPVKIREVANPMMISLCVDFASSHSRSGSATDAFSSFVDIFRMLSFLWILHH
jgi:hypothetical protein